MPSKAYAALHALDCRLGPVEPEEDQVKSVTRSDDLFQPRHERTARKCRLKGKGLARCGKFTQALKHNPACGNRGALGAKGRYPLCNDVRVHKLPHIKVITQHRLRCGRLPRAIRTSQNHDVRRFRGHDCESYCKWNTRRIRLRSLPAATNAEARRFQISMHAHLRRGAAAGRLRVAIRRDPSRC
jgi:hypothetical protein